MKMKIKLVKLAASFGMRKTTYLLFTMSNNEFYVEDGTPDDAVLPIYDDSDSNNVSTTNSDNLIQPTTPTGNKTRPASCDAPKRNTYHTSFNPSSSIVKTLVF